MKKRYLMGNVDNILMTVIVTILLGISTVVMLYPFMNVTAVAFSSYKSYILNPLRIFPGELNLTAFSYVFGSKMLIRSYANTVFVTVVGTIISLVMTTLISYSLSKRHLRGKRLIMSLLIFTMMFNGGLIPHFLLMKGLGLVDTYWALIIPYLLSPFNVVLMKNFFSNMPESLEEAARIDGASEFYTLRKIVIPLAMPIMATIALFVAVGYWNNYFAAVVYIRSTSKWPLQLLLREILLAASNEMLSADGNMAEMSADAIPMVSIRYATILVVIIPIVCVYPFLQRYFVKGVMLGGVKG
jgi:putative aldouronate transport system permease protein